MPTIAHVPAVHSPSALNAPWSDDLPPVAFDRRVSIRFDLDVDNLQLCGQCPLSEDTDAIYLVTHQTVEGGTDWPTGVCGRYCLHSWLYELLDRSVYERPVYGITLHLPTDWAVTPTLTREAVAAA